MAGLMPGETIAVQELGDFLEGCRQGESDSGAWCSRIYRLDSTAEDAGEALKALGGAKLALTTALSVDSSTPLIKGLNILGKLMVLNLSGKMTLSHNDMIQRGISVQAWPVGNCHDSERAIEFAHRHGVECAIETFPLAR